MLKILENQLEGMWAAPNHPITCANPAPWKIIEVKIRANQFASYNNKESVDIYIRGEGSMWFDADNCILSDTKEELEIYLDREEDKRKLAIKIVEVYAQ